VDSVWTILTLQPRGWKLRKRVDRIVIFPRYTAFVGTGQVYSAPIDVRAYGEAILTAWQGTGLGTVPATLEYTVEYSADLEIWVDDGSFSPAAGTEAAFLPDLRYPWLRVKAVVTGTDPGVTAWLVGDFVYREGLGAEEAA